MVFHHILGILATLWPVMSGKYACEMLVGAIQTESTNLIFSISQILSYHENLGHLTNIFSILFLISFTVIRSTFGLQLIIDVQRSLPNFLFVLITTSVWILSMYWVWMMLHKASKMAHEVIK